MTKQAIDTTLVGIATAVVISIGGGLVFTPLVFAGRVMPGLKLENQRVAGISARDLPGAVQRYGDELVQQKVTVALRGHVVAYPLKALGFTLNSGATSQRLLQPRLPRARTITPVLQTESKQLHQKIAADFADVITVPTNASLIISAQGTLQTTSSASGEAIDVITLEQNVLSRLRHAQLQQPIELTVVTAAPEVLDDEVQPAREFAAQLLRSGMKLTFNDEEHNVWPYIVRRLIAFQPHADINDPANEVLGVTFDADGLHEYLSSTIGPAIEQAPQDARFERESADRVSVFQPAQTGQHLQLEETATNISSALTQQAFVAPLAVEITEPKLASIEDIEELGVTDLLARGESDFAGSPMNRIHNVSVGASRYHGLLIEPRATFSFNEHLGPVDGAHGWKPELVIKNNVTAPEYGGGICQVSTTAFRAALLSGLAIDERRNHSYAVRYYGVPGFDATVYPGYTDLRFTNNTPSYILIQTRIEGTKLIFDFWGTNDGRLVTVDGPHPYARQPDGAVKATLSQSVIKEGETLIEDTFYSNYKSPKLYPKVLSADDPAGAAKSNANQPETTKETAPSTS